MGRFRMTHAEKFLTVDGLNNVTNEIIFSVLQRYNCFAGCKICYTQQDFKKALPKFNQFIPQTINSDMEQQWFNIFEYFYCVSSIDDIFWMKHNQEHLYKWYQQNDHRFQWGNMTDNNFVRSQPLFVNEFSSDTSIYEISFSAKWLDQIDINDTLDKLKVLYKRNGIQKIKFIFDSEDDYQIPNFKKVLDWTHDVGINKFNSSHHNFLLEMRELDSNDIVKYYDLLASDDGELFSTLNQSDYLQHDNFFMTLQQAIDVDSKPYYNFKQFDHNQHLYNMLSAKIQTYREWANRYNDGSIKPNESSNKHFKYFDWVSKHVKINSNFNFIPSNLLPSNRRYYNKIKTIDYVPTPYGLIKQGTENVVPLMEIINE